MLSTGNRNEALDNFASFYSLPSHITQIISDNCCMLGAAITSDLYF